MGEVVQDNGPHKVGDRHGLDPLSCGDQRKVLVEEGRGLEGGKVCVSATPVAASTVAC